MSDQLVALGCNVRLIEGAGGVFDVFVDGMLKFSKSKTIDGGFPSPKEIDEMV